MRKLVTSLGKFLPIVLVALSILFFVVPTKAYAHQLYTNCNANVIDDAHLLSDPGTISAKVDDLVNNTGIIVKVRTIQSYALAGVTNVEAYTSAMMTQCPSWTDGTGHFQSNYVLLLISISDRKSDYWVGDSLVNKLDMVSIEQTMGSQFHQKNFQQGMIDGLNGIGDSLSLGWWFGDHWLTVLLVILAILFVLWLVCSSSGGSGGGGSRNSTFFYMNSSNSSSSGGGGSFGGGSSIGGSGGSTGF